jgi:hypothetical protein
MGVHSREGIKMDRLAAMEVFVCIVDSGSFSGAAKQLRVGQPAVSKTIAQLEDRLGVRLLLRSTHGLTPTKAGRNFYDRSKRSIEEAEEAERAARGVGASLTGRLRFCAPPTFARLRQSVTCASKTAPTSGTDDPEAALKRIERLEQIAAWHRLNAEHAGSAWIWDARLRTAEDLERQAARLRAVLLPDNRVSAGEARPSR